MTTNESKKPKPPPHALAQKSESSMNAPATGATRLKATEKRIHRTTDVCNVYYCFIEDFIDEPMMSTMFRWLSLNERHFIHSIRNEKVRHTQLISRALLRFTLSQHHAVPHITWRFGVLPNGKPVISYPITSAALNFNISHTDKMLAIAITSGLPTGVGIDIENTLNPAIDINLVKSFFSPDELEFIEKTNKVYQKKAIFQIWTAKEAFTKCIGTGLSMALNAFTIKITDEKNLPYLAFFEHKPYFNNDFIFDTHQPTDGELITVCLSRKDINIQKKWIYNRITRTEAGTICTL